MVKTKENSRHNVISIRINEEERKRLESLMKKTHKKVSNLMREAIEYFVANYKPVKPDTRQPH